MPAACSRRRNIRINVYSCSKDTKYFGKTILCAEILQPRLEQAFWDLLDPDASEATKKRQVKVPVNSILTLAASNWGPPQGCPVPKFDKMPDGKPRKTKLLPHKAEQMIALATARGYHTLACVIAVGVMEGPRRGEFFNLDWRFVDLARAYMTLRNVKARPTETRDRLVDDLRPRTIAALKALSALTGLASGPVFRRGDGSLFPSVQAFGKAMNDQLKALAHEIGHEDADNVTLHVLRHMSASYHFAMDPNPERVRIRGDWETDSSARRYIHLLPKGTRLEVFAFAGLEPD
jgi:integrase